MPSEFSYKMTPVNPISCECGNSSILKTLAGSTLSTILSWIIPRSSEYNLNDGFIYLVSFARVDTRLKPLLAIRHGTSYNARS